MTVPRLFPRTFLLSSSAAAMTAITAALGLAFTVQPLAAQNSAAQAAIGGAALPAKYEKPGTVATASVLPAAWLNGAIYQLSPQAQTDGLRNSYVITSDFGNFTARGNSLLVRRIRELYAIAALDQMSNTEEFADALKQTGKAKLQTAENVLRDPVGTVRSLPKGLISLGKRAGGFLSSRRDRDPHADSTVDQALSVSKARRALAAMLNVDPETRNPVLRDQLNRVAWVRAMAGLGLNIATAQLAPAQLAVGLTVVGATGTLQQAAKTKSPEEVRQAAVDQLRQLGVSGKTATRFLNNTAFTTLQLASIIDQLVIVGPTPGMGSFVDWMLSADSEADACFFEETAALVGAYASGKSSVRQFIRTGPMIVFQDAQGNIVVPVSGDYVMWTSQTAAAAARLAKLRSANSAPPVTVLVSGRVSPATAAVAAARGVTLISGIGEQPNLLNQ